MRDGAALAGVLTLVLLGAGCGGGEVSGGGSASCVGPYLDSRPPGSEARAVQPTVQAGESVRIYGHWYTSTCNDTGGNDALQPLRPVHLTLTLPGGDVRDLGRFAPAGDDMGFTVPVDVPAGTPAGTARLSDDRDPPATFEFRVAE